jgi:hypothetical protein
VKDLVFFNKSGYAYNFVNNNDYYEGKLMFDENSSDTYKTIGIYVFESVAPKYFNCLADLNKIEIFNYSGMSFNAQIEDYADIDNIAKVNSSPEFRSKWIYGTSFDKKFPQGSIIRFSGVTFDAPTTDFNNLYYTVLSTKPGAIMVVTPTTNDVWSLTFTGGGICSLNIISVHNYVNSYNFYYDKKISVVNTNSNDGVYSYRDSGYTYYTTYEFDLNNITGNTLKVDINLYTERPVIYSGSMTVTWNAPTVTGITFEFDNYIKTSSILKEGDTFYVEDFNDDTVFTGNPEFTIYDVVDYNILHNDVVYFYKTYDRALTVYNINQNGYNVTYEQTLLNSTYRTLAQPIYFIELVASATTLVVGDYIETISNPYITGSTMNHNKKFKITAINYRTLKDMRVSFWQNQIFSNYNLISTSKQNSVQFKSNIDAQILNDAQTMYDIIDYPVYTSGATEISTIQFQVDAEVINESGNTYQIAQDLEFWQIKKLLCYSSTNPINPLTYTGDAILYLSKNSFTLEQDLLTGATTTEENWLNTVDAFYVNYNTLLDKYGIDVYYNSGLSYMIMNALYSINNSAETYFTADFYFSSTQTGVTNSYLETRSFFNVDEQLSNESTYIYDIDNLARDYHAEILFDLSNDMNDYGFTISFNTSEFFVNYNTDSGTTTCTHETINLFLSAYTNAFSIIGIDISSGLTVSGYTLILDGQYPNVDVYNLSVKVNQYSTYNIIDEIKNYGALLSANELYSSTSDFYSYEMSSGMILSIFGSSYSFNNKEYNILGLTQNTIELSYQGPFFDENNIPLSATTREFLRKPRESYNDNVRYKFYWETEVDEIFFYDFLGTQLDRIYEDNNFSGPYVQYTGQLPLVNVNDCNLNNVYLNPEPIEQIKLDYEMGLENTNPEYQQTVFDDLYFELDTYNSDNYNYIPEPLQVFLGYNSVDEGVSYNTLVMEKIETLSFTGYTSSLEYFNVNSIGRISFLTSSASTYYTTNFQTYGFRKGQNISVKITDQNTTGQTLFENFAIYEVLSVNPKEILVSTGSTNFTGITWNTFTTTGGTYFFNINVEPQTYAKIQIYGETENEDERFKVMLNNLGIQINPEDEFIFKESDVSEFGIDYIRLNAKRKEMLSVYPDIWNYIGAYKSLINAINFFGYNDLQLYEYYRNINPSSSLYHKLRRTLIKDIFDNTIEGWTEMDPYADTYEQGNWKKTNLFNLTYQITDEEGNYVNMYSLEDVQYKLTGLKRWLKRNILPLSTNIVDITGVAEVPTTQYLTNDTSFVNKIHTLEDETTAINFITTETLNFNTNYLLTINFYTLGTDIIPSAWTAKIRTFSQSGTTLYPEQYFKLQKNDLNSFSFNIDKNVDPFLMIETMYYNEYGLGIKYNKLINTSTSKVYLLINNNFHIPNYQYLNYDNGYYFFDKDGYIILED